RCTCRTSPSPIRRTASRPASASRSGLTAARSASPSVRESRSMAEEDKKAKKGEKADAAPKAKGEQQAKGQAKGEGGDKAKDAKGDKGGDKGARPAKGEKPAPEAQEPEPKGPPRLRVFYDKEVRAKLVEKFGYKNAMQVPTIDKIVINMGIGEAVADRKKVESAAGDLALIAGQKPVITKSRKAISTYKLRENQPIGCKVTLRKTRMFEFLHRLI